MLLTRGTESRKNTMQKIINPLSQGTILHGKIYNYEVIKVLGQGSFGITYLASVKMRGELGAIAVYVAIKEFFMRDVNGRENSMVTNSNRNTLYEKYKQKFIKEAQNLSKLEHPNIIKVMESFEANNTVYYVMEYLGEGSLDGYIIERGGLSEQETLRFAGHIASALSFMHSRGMLHLDLKPGNIMLKNGEAVLIDFGLSKQYDENGNPESSTTIGGGTPGYAPIEQSSYNGNEDEIPVTMDIYALGATLYKMLIGQRPADASDLFNDGFPYKTLRAKGVSEPTIQLIAKAMAPGRKERIATADKFRQALAPPIGANGGKNDIGG